MNSPAPLQRERSPRKVGMRQRLAQHGPLGRLFEKDDGDEPMDAVMRRFWSRTGLAIREGAGPGNAIVDLSRWRRERAERGGR